jgi:autotransporter-associated beta strand protein
LGAANSYTSTTYIQQGVLRATHATALGNVSPGTIVQAGAALELSNNITVGAEALSINGTGISNGGALRNYSGSNNYDGLITIGVSGARINSDASSSLTLRGGIVTTLTQDVTFGGAGNTTVSSTAISGSGRVIKDGLGTLTLSAVNTYTGATLVSAGTLYVSGSLVSDVTVSDTATLAGGGTVDDLILGGGSLLDIFLAVSGTPDSLAATTISFAATGFGIDNLLSNGVAVNWGTISNGTYTLITGTLNSTNLGNFGSANAYDIGGGRSAYFQDGSLQLVVQAIPEPRAALLGCLGILLLFRRRR